ncbi:MAG: type II secretion system protein [Candidatus Melainabacteria bacterium]
MGIDLKYRKQLPGFTLAELLIALAILGVIATFTVSKILTVQNSGQRQAVLKETYSAINTILLEARLDGSINYSAPTVYTTLTTRLNAVKLCPTNATTEGCFSHDTTIPFPVERTEPGFILASGATVAGINNGSSYEGFAIDYNGPDGPNQDGQDQLYMTFNINATPMAETLAPFGATSIALYHELFD